MSCHSLDNMIGIANVILQTARIYSRATGKCTLLAFCSRDSLQVLPVCSINTRNTFEGGYGLLVSDIYEIETI